MIGIATAGMATDGIATGCTDGIGGSKICFALPSSFVCVLAIIKRIFKQAIIIIH